MGGSLLTSSAGTADRCRAHGIATWVSMAMVGTLAIAAITLLPTWLNPAERARTRQTRQTLDDFRVAIERFKQQQAFDGWPRPPTYVELQIPGVVLDGGVPVNPLNGSRIVVPAAGSTAMPLTGAEVGWCYDEAEGRVWSASEDLGANRW